MPVIWLPEKSKPQVSEEAKTAVAERVLGEGVAAVSGTALSVLQNTQEPLAEYMDRLGFTLNDISREGIWPDRVLKIGGSLALSAYRETGYFQSVTDDTFAIGKALALLDGIPEAYLASIAQDSELQSLLEIVRDAPDFAAPNPEGYQQVLDMGAGCVRFYLQSSLEAA